MSEEEISTSDFVGATTEKTAENMPPRVPMQKAVGSRPIIRISPKCTR